MADKEQLSALMDGELNDHSALDAVANDGELRQSWSNYHLIGDVLRGELPKSIDLDFSARVSAAIAEEPTLLAPRPAATVAVAKESAKVVPFMRRAAYQLGQYAIAASVAAAVIFGVQQYGQDPAQNPQLNTIPIGGGAAPVSVHYPQESARGIRSNEETQNAQRQRLNAYLWDHQLQQRLQQMQMQQQPSQP